MSYLGHRVYRAFWVAFLRAAVWSGVGYFVWQALDAQRRGAGCAAHLGRWRSHAIEHADRAFRAFHDTGLSPTHSDHGHRLWDIDGVFWGYGKYGVGTIFFSDADPQFIQVSVLGRGNFSASEVNELVLEVESEVLQIPAIRFVNTQSLLPGAGDGNSGFMGGSSDRIGSIFLELVAEADRDLGGKAIMSMIRERTDSLAGIKVEVQPLEKGPRLASPYRLNFHPNNAICWSPPWLA